MTWLLGLPSKLYAYAGIALAAALAVFGIYRKGRRSAQADAKVDQYEQVIEDVETTRRVEREVAATPDAALDDELRKSGWSRD